MFVVHRFVVPTMCSVTGWALQTSLGASFLPEPLWAGCRPGPVEARVEMRKEPSWALLGEAQPSGLGPAPWLWNWEAGPS